MKIQVLGPTLKLGERGCLRILSLHFVQFFSVLPFYLVPCMDSFFYIPCLPNASKILSSPKSSHTGCTLVYV
jgi:hypothetical protein